MIDKASEEELKNSIDIVDIISNYYQDGEDAYLMVLDLTQSTQEAPLS